MGIALVCRLSRVHRGNVNHYTGWLLHHWLLPAVVFPVRFRVEREVASLHVSRTVPSCVASEASCQEVKGVAAGPHGAVLTGTATATAVHLPHHRGGSKADVATIHDHCHENDDNGDGGPGPVETVPLSQLSRYLSSTGGPCVWICNHQSALDILTMSFIWPPRVAVLAKEAIAYYPILGWYMSLAETIFIRRQDRTKAISAIQDCCREIVHNKMGVFLFPEGTRSHSLEPEMLPFKKGAFHMALDAGVPIVPMVFSHYAPVYSFREARLIPGTVTIRILKPIVTAGRTLEELMKETYSNMSRVYKTIHSVPTKQLASDRPPNLHT